jgi:hypothetical protein
MRRTARVAVVGLALSGLSAIAVPEASAAGVTSIGLGSHLNKVQTSTGKALKLFITASKNTANGSTDKASVGVTLSTHSPYSKGETHSWLFHVSRNSFDYTSGSGNGSLDASLGKYGSVSLSFSKTGQSGGKCAVSGSRTIVKGRLHGAIHFDTNTKAWGKVNDKSFTFDTPNSITVSKSCNDGEGSGGTPTCFAAKTWSAPPIIGNGSSFVSGSSQTIAGKTKTVITGTRTVNLSKPAGSTRTDILAASGPAPTANGNTLTVKTSSSGPVSGSAKVAGDAPQNGQGYACKINGQKKTEHSKSYYAGDAWSSPNGIKFNFKASADLVSPKSGATGWTENSYS